MVKPDSEIYEHVANELGCPKENIIFFDDSEMNVKAAIEVGIQSFLVKSPEAARKELRKMGLI